MHVFSLDLWDDSSIPCTFYVSFLCIENIVVVALRHLEKDKARHPSLSPVCSHPYTAQHRGQEHSFRNQPPSEISSIYQLRDLDQVMEPLYSLM